MNLNEMAWPVNVEQTASPILGRVQESEVICILAIEKRGAYMPWPRVSPDGGRTLDGKEVIT